jgi:maleate isomerase
MSAAPTALLTPMANPTVEREMRRLLPPECDYLVGRLVATERDSQARLRQYAERLNSSLKQFGGIVLNSIAFACTASSYLVGREGEDRIAAETNVPILWAARTISDLLADLGAKRIVVISPYPEEIHLAGLAYWRSSGLLVTDHHRIEIGSPDTRSIYALKPDAAKNALALARKAKPDVILLSGTGMPTLKLIDPAGEPPVISSNYCLARMIIAQQDAPS